MSADGWTAAEWAAIDADRREREKEHGPAPARITLCPGCSFGSWGGTVYDKLGRQWHSACYARADPSVRDER